MAIPNGTYRNIEAEFTIMEISSSMYEPECKKFLIVACRRKSVTAETLSENITGKCLLFLGMNGKNMWNFG